MVALLCALLHMASSCSVGEATRFLKPHEICLQSFGSLLDVSIQLVFSGETNLTSGKKNNNFCCYTLHQTTEKFSVF